MPAYDFKNLSPIDFEGLVRDLIQADLGERLESFKPGKDQGIDFRYSSSASGDVVVQCKHYAESSISGLLRHLRLEAKKVAKLKPSRYVLATSLGLSPLNKKAIREMFTPYIKEDRDIYGREDLNNLLGLNPEVEQRNFKLWLTSSAIFEEILNKKARNISREALETIREHARFYVQNESFDEAYQILEKLNVCIIAGIPGIGKTMLAEMLVLNYVKAGYELVRITNDISEASAVDYHNVPRVFYYDDFLGQTSLSDKLNKNEDQSLIDFIHAVNRSGRSKFILTTREYILNQARFLYERLAREDFGLMTCVVDLQKYTRRNRAKILFNHLYFADLPEPYKKAIFESQRYLVVIDHLNFSPRIISLLTKYTRVRNETADGYVPFLLKSLDNPSELWRHAFEEQISLSSKELLITLASMPAEVFLEDARQAFQAHYSQTARRFNLSLEPQGFDHALKELDGNFLASERSRDKIVIKFHNPSIRDFMNNYTAGNPEEVIRLIEAAVFYDQLITIWRASKGSGIARALKKSIIDNLAIFIAAMRRTLNAPTCRLINVGTSQGDTYKDKWLLSFEEKANLIAEVANDTDVEQAWEFWREVTINLKHRLDNRTADREDLARLVLTLKRAPERIRIESQILIHPCLEYLSSEGNWIKDYEPFSRILKEWPEAVPLDLYDTFKTNFEKAVDEYDPDSDPQWIRDDVETMREIGSVAGVDVSVEAARFEVQASELETEENRIDADFVRKDQDKKETWCSDEEISSMFSTFNR